MTGQMRRQGVSLNLNRVGSRAHACEYLRLEGGPADEAAESFFSSFLIRFSNKRLISEEMHTNGAESD